VESHGDGGAARGAIEDNADARAALTALLELEGYLVEAAPDGAAGLEMVTARRPDVALIDIGLPGMDGYEVARRIRDLGPPQPHLAALTGYSRPENRERAAEAGFDTHLVKPIDPAALSDLVKPRRAWSLAEFRFEDLADEPVDGDRVEPHVGRRDDPGVHDLPLRQLVEHTLELPLGVALVAADLEVFALEHDAGRVPEAEDARDEPLVHDLGFPEELPVRGAVAAGRDDEAG
jgi:CheY-like chemotaxis protein